MHHYLTVDGMLGGTGVRDTVEGGFLLLEELGLSPDLVSEINAWILKYAQEHYNGFRNTDANHSLDEEGVAIARKIKEQKPECKIEYFSDAYMLKKYSDEG
jgi:hypothetical protein